METVNDEQVEIIKPPTLRQRLFAGLTRNVVVLGVVSLFTDISSEMIVPVRIIFLVVILNTPVTLAGLIEGIAESTASIVKVFSGRLADRVSKRKPIILAGYGISNLCKPLLSLVTSWPQALGLIFLDRAGKGVRGSPRDAMIADSIEAKYRGKAFGLHRAMDTMGAAIGPLFAALILALTDQNLRALFAWTLLPGILAVVVVIFFLREPPREPIATPQPDAIKVPFWQGLGALGAPFWMFTSASTLFAVGNSSDAFVFLRTEGLEGVLEAVPLVYFGYNLVYALLATPLGVLSDRYGRIPVLLAGYISFGLVYMGWAAATEPWQPWALFFLYGVYAAATEGVGKALVSDLIPRGKRGTAMGWFNGMVGLAALPANLIGGALWATFGPAATFNFGAVAAFAAALLLYIFSPRFQLEKAA